MTQNLQNCTQEGDENSNMPIILSSISISTSTNTSSSTTLTSSTINDGNSTNSTKSYIWTKDDTAELISWRIRNKALFTGRRNAALKGFEEFIKLRGLSGKIDPIKVKRKWENLKQRYKELKTCTGRVGTGAEETSAASWKWFAAMDEALKQTPCKNEPILCISSGQEVMLTPRLSLARKKSQNIVIPVKRRKEQELPNIIQAMLDREEERERIYLEKDERREWEAQEREERKEKERLDREDKREKERIDREERMERERKEWEERRDRESREREERREREWIERLERWEKERREWEDKRERDSREREERWHRENQMREEKLLEVIKLIMEKK
ncbi:trichohyalin-like [Trichomycterus rosablanca]|uniref:trichohyalin-like n=1 Tax=Trichomycterus rosablanca TaxID=2290929 RepID=UPI002F352A2D